MKPANLLLAPGGTVKVADFGIAHLPGEGTTTLTAAGQIIGSTHYLAPERAKGAQAGKPADVYALGCVLYELVTGRPPFKGEHPTAILYQHVDAAPEPPSLAVPSSAGRSRTYSSGCSRRLPLTVHPPPTSRPAPYARSQAPPRRWLLGH